MAGDLIFLIPELIINLTTLWFFWKKRSDGAEVKKTVEKYAKNLLVISIGDSLCHVLWTATDLSVDA